MRKHLLLLFFAVSALFVLSASYPDAFATDCSPTEQCYSQIRTNPSSPVQGVQFQLDSPDLYIDRHSCTDRAVSAGWLTAAPTEGTENFEWMESGITRGEIRVGLFGDTECVAQTSIYYGVNNVDELGDDVYQENLSSLGRVDYGEDITVIIEDKGIGVETTVTTPEQTRSLARLSLRADNVYSGLVGIEGTISATDRYSTIPMSKFTNMKIKQNDSWINFPSTATVFTGDADEGYMGKKCSDGFVAGTTTSLDCSVNATINQIPNAPDQTIRITGNTPHTINLVGVDTDKDYLTYHLVSNPTKGTLDHNNLRTKIPNIDGDSARLVYTPTHTPSESDSIVYSVTDGRSGHTREGTVSIIGQVPPIIMPDPIDDLAYTLSGNIIRFTWSHPSSPDTPITSYRMERSQDTVSWQHHDTISETRTSLDYNRYGGYEMYFRIFANSADERSASSNVLYVRIADDTPPVVRILKPLNGQTFPVSNVSVVGYIQEGNSDVYDIQLRIDNTPYSEPATITSMSSVFTNWMWMLENLANGSHTIKVSATNEDDLIGTAVVSVVIDIPVPNTVSSFSDDFETDLSQWISTGQKDTVWSIRDNPTRSFPDSHTGNNVAGTDNCDSTCTLRMIDHVDLAAMTSRS